MKRTSQLLSFAAMLLPAVVVAQSESNYEQGLGFSPTGRLYQIEFAAEAAARQGAPTVCIRGRTTCVLASRRRVGSASGSAAGGSGGAGGLGARLDPALVDARSVKQVHAVSRGVGFAASGVPGDELRQAEMLRERALAFRRRYGHEISAARLALYLADSAQEATQGVGETRPLGTSAFLVGLEEDPDELTGMRHPAAYRVEPSGNVFLCARWSCAGQHSESARAWLQRQLRARRGWDEVAVDDDEEEEEGAGEGEGEGGDSPPKKKKKTRHLLEWDEEKQPEGPTCNCEGYAAWSEPPMSYDGGIYGLGSFVAAEGGDGDGSRGHVAETEEEDLVSLALGCLAQLPTDEGSGSGGGDDDDDARDAKTLAARYHVGVLSGGGAPFRFVSGGEMAKALSAIRKRK